MLKIFDLFYNFRTIQNYGYYSSYPTPAIEDFSYILVTFKNQPDLTVALVVLKTSKETYIETEITEEIKDKASVNVVINQSIQECYENGLDIEKIEIINYKNTEGELVTLLNNLDVIFYHMLGGTRVRTSLPTNAVA